MYNIVNGERIQSVTAYSVYFPHTVNGVIKQALRQNQRLVLQVWTEVDSYWMFEAFDDVFEQYSMDYVLGLIKFEWCSMGFLTGWELLRFCKTFWRRTRRVEYWAAFDKSQKSQQAQV